MSGFIVRFTLQFAILLFVPSQLRKLIRTTEDSNGCPETDSIIIFGCLGIVPLASHMYFREIRRPIKLVRKFFSHMYNFNAIKLGHTNAVRLTIQQTGPTIIILQRVNTLTLKCSGTSGHSWNYLHISGHITEGAGVYNLW
jgi:hypothetical protein